MGLQEIQNERFENSEYWPKQDSEVLKGSLLGACVLQQGELNGRRLGHEGDELPIGHTCSPTKSQ